MKNQQYSSWIGKSDENPHRQDHDHHGPMMRSISSDDCSHVIIRPYTCAFCNRGFSSAQALGGHMNIHRKDRAKLKLQALAATAAAKQEDQEDQEDQENMPLDPRVLDDDEDFFLLESHQQKRADHIHDKRPGSAQDHATSTSLSLSRSLSVPELDLELRLGPASLPAG